MSKDVAKLIWGIAQKDDDLKSYYAKCQDWKFNLVNNIKNAMLKNIYFIKLDYYLNFDFIFANDQDVNNKYIIKIGRYCYQIVNPSLQKILDYCRENDLKFNIHIVQYKVYIEWSHWKH